MPKFFDVVENDSQCGEKETSVGVSCSHTHNIMVIGETSVLVLGVVVLLLITQLLPILRSR